MWPSVFHVNADTPPDLSCLEWLHKGDPMLGAGVEFKVGPVAAYRQSGGDVVGRVKAMRRRNRQAAKHEERNAGRV